MTCQFWEIAVPVSYSKPNKRSQFAPRNIFFFQNGKSKIFLLPGQATNWVHGHCPDRDLVVPSQPVPLLLDSFCRIKEACSPDRLLHRDKHQSW
jgi:hypothetical protein